MYLDHAASSPLTGSAAAAMAEVWGRPGNPSSLHASGREFRRLLEQARESIAADLGAHPSEVVFTSGGTEANNLAVLGAVGAAGEVLISAVEHPSVAEARRVLGERAQVLEVDASGRVDPGVIPSRVRPATRLVSVMWVNNETGVVQPVAAVAAAARAAGVLAHSDAVQAAGQLAVDFGAAGLDLMSVSAHKVGGPVGIGALLVRRGVTLLAPGFGGGQEARLRSGTVPVALAVGFAAALRQAVDRLDREPRRLAGLRDRLLVGLSGLDGVVVNSTAPASPAILNATFAGTRADDLLLLLDAAGIDCSTGSACTAGVHQPSEVLLAMGRTLAEASASLRFSFGASTGEADIDALLGALPDALVRARAAY
ncbi:MAG: cysteine desulfurase family protein [Propionicimonas sp.]|uniref:cysteine desulfurase family protein n=1 Tax=Propionicimonas sp. TaxID=1955623 RepID=UPI002B20916F|nr:cysteine desulfurase family protein [Propionicimonas sp.]MEA4943179.1 cysteine desulfurase family protein [Propionicimonas sp.]